MRIYAARLFFPLFISLSIGPATVLCLKSLEIRSSVSTEDLLKGWICFRSETSKKEKENRECDCSKYFRVFCLSRLKMSVGRRTGDGIASKNPVIIFIISVKAFQ